MSDNGVTPPGTAEKNLGEIVAEVTSKSTLLVQEEIALAKAEVSVKVSRLVKGIVCFALAGFLALLMLIFVFHTLSYGFADWLGVKTWVGYGITTVLLLVLTGLSALIGLRLFKKGSPPTPQLAIEEAQKTKVALKEARS
jgi:Putative Actinobacterial Holin-X, holin superfamily III